MKALTYLTAAAAIAFFSAGHAAQAQPASIGDCEKIEAWDAYNKCLATFGRKRGAPVRVTHSDGPAEAAAPRVSRGRAARNSGFLRRGRNGRAYAVFDVSGPAKQSQPRRRGRR